MVDCLSRERAPNCGIKGKAAYHVTALNPIRQWQSNTAGHIMVKKGILMAFSTRKRPQPSLHECYFHKKTARSISPDWGNVNFAR